MEQHSIKTAVDLEFLTKIVQIYIPSLEVKIRGEYGEIRVSNKLIYETYGGINTLELITSFISGMALTCTLFENVIK